MPHIRPSYLVIVLVAVAVMVGLLLPHNRQSGHSASPAPEASHPAPTFQLARLDGASQKLTSLRGQVVLINFWATWCGPCRSEMPRLAVWYRRLHRRGFVVLGVDKQEPASDVQTFTQHLRIPYPVVIDSSGSTFARYNVVPMPESFLIDRKGVVNVVSYGVLDEQFFMKHVEPLVSAG